MTYMYTVQVLGGNVITTIGDACYCTIGATTNYIKESSSFKMCAFQQGKNTMYQPALQRMTNMFACVYIFLLSNSFPVKFH